MHGNAYNIHMMHQLYHCHSICHTAPAESHVEIQGSCLLLSPWRKFVVAPFSSLHGEAYRMLLLNTG